MRALLNGARRHLADLGLEPIPVELPRAEETNDIGTLLLTVDLWLHHERYQERAALYGRHFTARAAVERSVMGVDYAKAKAAQADIRRRWLELFETADVLVLPSNVVGGPPHGVDEAEVDAKTRLIAVGPQLEQALGNLCRQWGIEPRR